MNEEEKEGGKEIEKEGGVYVAASHRPKPTRKDASQRMKKSLHRPRYPTLVYHLKSSSSEEASSVPSDESVSGPDFHLKAPRSNRVGPTCLDDLGGGKLLRVRVRPGNGNDRGFERKMGR